MKKRNVGSQPGTKEPLGLRVIGGKLRGSKLQYIGDNRVRPMKDRTREALFNLIGPSVKEQYVIDLFGGTGAVAIEALSRGSLGATIIELHIPTAMLLKQNIEALGLQDVCALRKTDAFFWAKNIEEHPHGKPWLVFCCPPYSFYTARCEEMREMIHGLYKAAPDNSTFVIEADNLFDFATLPVEPDEQRRRSYPPAEIAIFDKRNL
jgi:16S rRNA (guanine966-N2)-methyltransferase